MARTDPVWVFVDARYARETEGWRGEVPALGVTVRARTREETWEELSRAVARHLRPLLIQGKLDEHLDQLGFYRSPEGEWIPRVTGEDERVYVRVTPIESLPLHQAGDPAEDDSGEGEDPAAED